MTGNTGLLTERCDPYGAESTVKLMGGTVDPKHAGKYMWHCDNRAEARYRFFCRGGRYGFRRANDGGLVEAYECPGGHKGVPMPLCRTHVLELTGRQQAPGYTADMQTPVGVIGGTVANQMCPACAVGAGSGREAVIRDRMAEAEALQQQVARAQMLGLISVAAQLQARQDQVTATLNELHERGFIHRCPLKLVEVS